MAVKDLPDGEAPSGFGSGCGVESLDNPRIEHHENLPPYADKRRALVLLGNEPQGLPDAVVAQADECLEIPMVRRGASLNVAVAGSLVRYRLAGLF